MKLKPTRQEYEWQGLDGYRFKVVAEWNDDKARPFRRGWSASVTMESEGFKTPEDAVNHLRHEADAFLRHTKGEG